MHGLRSVQYSTVHDLKILYPITDRTIFIYCAMGPPIFVGAEREIPRTSNRTHIPVTFIQPSHTSLLEASRRVLLLLQGRGWGGDGTRQFLKATRLSACNTRYQVHRRRSPQGDNCRGGTCGHSVAAVCASCCAWGRRGRWLVHGAIGQCPQGR